MLDPRGVRIPTWVLPLIPVVLFIPTLISFAFFEPGAVWVEYSGVFFHLAILLLIARLDAPQWAKAAGYGWIILDVLSGILSINGVAYDVTWPVRLGGHVLAGVWLVMVSLYSGRRVVQVTGVLTGVWLGGYSFLAPHVPEYVIAPTSLLIVVWFISLAVVHRHDPSGSDALTGTTPAPSLGGRPPTRS